jgi:hypothetical protein
MAEPIANTIKDHTTDTKAKQPHTNQEQTMQTPGILEALYGKQAQPVATEKTSTATAPTTAGMADALSICLTRRTPIQIPRSTSAASTPESQRRIRRFCLGSAPSGAIERMTS